MGGMLLHEGFIAPTLATLTGLFLFSPTLKSDLRAFRTDAGLISITLVFLVSAVSLLWSENIEYGVDRVRLKLPFLALPVVAMGWRALPYKWFLLSLKFFLAVALLSGAGVIINYLVNPEAVNELISRGKHIAVPVNHIRYSLLIAIAALVAIYLFDRQDFRRRERFIYLAAAILLAAFLHVLAVRSGLVGFYVAMVFIILRALFVKRRWLLGFGLIAVLIASPFVAYQAVESFRSRVAYMRHDLEVFFSGETPAGYSDIKRIISMQAGMELGKDNPVFGVGMGDVRDALNQVYAEKKVEVYSGTLPHNQFIVFFAGTGIAGLLLALIGMMAPIFTQHRSRSWPFVAMTLLLLTSCLFEATLEVQLGVAVYAFFTVFWIALLKSPASEV